MILFEKSNRQMVICIVIGVVAAGLFACAGDGGGGSGAGSYIAELVFPAEIPRTAAEGASSADGSGIDCAAAGIATITCAVYSAENTPIAEAAWECRSGRGIVENIPAGQNLTVVVTAEDAGGMVLLRGEDGEVAIEADLRTRGHEIFLHRADSPMVSAGEEPKTLAFDWGHIRFPAGADHYQLQVDPDGDSGFTAVEGAENLPGTEHELIVPVHFTDWVNALYRVVALDAVGNVVGISSEIDLLTTVSSAEVIGYFKASNPDAGDQFGWSAALSADGTVLAVGATHEAGGGEESDNSMPGSGAVYIFRRGDEGWRQEAYLKAGNADAGDYFGIVVALSADGSALAVGAYNEDGGGEESDNSLENSGAVYVFRNGDEGWRQEAYLKAGNADAGDDFGQTVALSADGSALAVGALREDSGGEESDNSLENSGAAYVFRRGDEGWRQEAYLKAGNTDEGDCFGAAVSLSADGATLAVGATGEAGGGEEGDNSMPDSGAVYVFRHSGNAWRQEAYLKASNTDEGDGFGGAVSLSADGFTLAVGADWEDGAVGESDNRLENSGAVYVFTHSGEVWRQQAYVKAGNIDERDHFGWSVSLSADGATLSVGAAFEAGIDNRIGNSGAAYVFTRSGDAWHQQAYLVSGNPDVNDQFGLAVSLSADGGTLAVGAYEEDSSAAGIGGEPGDNSLENSGAVYLY